MDYMHKLTQELILTLPKQKCLYQIIIKLQYGRVQYTY